MGYMRHHAIVVTSFDRSLITKAHAKASEIFPVVSAILDSRMNGFLTLLVPPDGSKEGWVDSDDGDVSRNQFVEWLESQRHSDGSTSLDWVEVQYGDDEYETRICRDSDAVRRNA